MTLLCFLCLELLYTIKLLGEHVNIFLYHHYLRYLTGLRCFIIYIQSGMRYINNLNKIQTSPCTVLQLFSRVKSKTIRGSTYICLYL